MRVYKDLHRVEEDARIRIIGESAMAGNTVGVVLEANEPDKIARYLRKLAERYPELTYERMPDDGLLAAFKFTRKDPPR